MLLPDLIEIGQEFPDGTYDNRTHDMATGDDARDPGDRGGERVRASCGDDA